jgi:hypothetical protein
MRLLKDHFKSAVVTALSDQWGIDYVEQAQALTDKQLMRARYCGPAFISKLRALPSGELKETPRYAIAHAYDDLRRSQVRLEIAMREHREAVEVFNKAAVKYGNVLPKVN